VTEDSQAPEAAPDTPPAPAAPVHDDYLTSGDRFVRWNLISLVIGLAALAAGALALRVAA
jgi:hypothetical protein